jgi:NADPH2:quinone reductase
MRALVATPESSEQVELRDVPEPEPSPNETVIRVGAISLNRGEVNRLASAPAGTRMGWDIAGTIEREATDGSGPATGTRVVAFVREAGWAELVAAPTTNVAPIPDDLSVAAAATLPVAGLTALRMLRLGSEALGRRVLVTGASGGVGRFAVQLGSNSGAMVTAVSRNEERSRGLTEIGAAATVEEVDQAEGPFDLILESVGGSSLAAAIGLVAPGGALVVFGNSSRQPTTFDVSSFYGKNGAMIIAFSLLAPSQDLDFRPDLRTLAEEMAAGKLDPQIGYQSSWRDASKAITALTERQVNGKAVLTVD